MQRNDVATLDLQKLINSADFTMNEIMYLIQTGASPDVKNENGLSLVQILFEKGSDTELLLLVEKYKANLAWGFGFSDSLQLPSKLKEQKQIGKGRFSIVTKGQISNQDVAIKQLNYQDSKSLYKSGYKNFLKNYINECRVLAKVTEKKSINIVKFVGMNNELSYYRIAMSYANNGNLHKAIKYGLYNAAAVKEKILLGLSQGLNIIHDYKIIHSDLKSKNVLLDRDWNPIIADFGLSSKVNLNFQTGRGTQFNWPPEMLSGKAVNSKATDVFSLATIFFEVLTLSLVGERLPNDVAVTRHGLFDFFNQGRRYKIFPHEASFKQEMLVNWSWQTKAEDRPSAAELLLAFNQDEDELFNKLNGILTNLLALACKHGRLDWVKKIVELCSAEEKAFLINQICSEDSNALHLACEYGHQPIVEYLAENGADIFAQNFNEQTPFYLACKNGHLSIVNYFLTQYSHLLDINLVDNNKDTALGVACKNGYLEIVEKLLQCDAIQINLPNNQGKTALFIALVNVNIAVARLLLEKNGEIKRVFTLDYKPSYFSSLSLLMKICLFVDKKKNQTGLFTFLINEMKEDIFKLNEQAETALDIACKLNNEVAVKEILLAAYKNPNSLTKPIASIANLDEIFDAVELKQNNKEFFYQQIAMQYLHLFLFKINESDSSMNKGFFSNQVKMSANIKTYCSFLLSENYSSKQKLKMCYVLLSDINALEFKVWFGCKISMPALRKFQKFYQNYEKTISPAELAEEKMQDFFATIQPKETIPDERKACGNSK